MNTAWRPWWQAARARRGQVTRWTGFVAHLTETCVTDVANVMQQAAAPEPGADTGQRLGVVCGGRGGRRICVAAVDQVFGAALS